MLKNPESAHPFTPAGYSHIYVIFVGNEVNEILFLKNLRSFFLNKFLIFISFIHLFIYSFIHFSSVNKLKESPNFKFQIQNNPSNYLLKFSVMSTECGTFSIIYFSFE